MDGNGLPSLDEFLVDIDEDGLNGNEEGFEKIPKEEPTTGEWLRI